jgi:hypothetical protein
MRAAHRICCLLILSGLAACSFSIPDSPRYGAHPPTVTGEDEAAPNQPAGASRDLETCRRSADRSMGSDASIDPADDHTANPMVLARREEMRSTYQTLVDQCMGNPR